MMRANRTGSVSARGRDPVSQYRINSPVSDGASNPEMYPYLLAYLGLCSPIVDRPRRVAMMGLRNNRAARLLGYAVLKPVVSSSYNEVVPLRGQPRTRIGGGMSFSFLKK